MSKIVWNLEPFNEKLEVFLDEKAEVIARQVSMDAKASTAFKNKTGKLRRSIKAKKSKFADGGWIVKAGGKGARQAWLVEHGHGGPMPAAPKAYLGPALLQNIGFAKQQFGAE